MKQYQKPIIEEETIELEDIIALSGVILGGEADPDSEIIDTDTGGNFF